MQTFLPYASFARSAAVLDDRRLGKQRVEVLQILRALHLEDYGWGRHPAVLMWRGCTRALVAYGFAVVDEWRARGHGDSTRARIGEFTCPHAALAEDRLPPDVLPPWLGWSALHRSHRAALVRKDPDVYRFAFPDADEAQPYVWPAPPAGPPHQEPFAAWVLRPTSPEVRAGFLEGACVGLPIDLGRPHARPKQRRQMHRFSDVIRDGDLLVLLDEHGLHRAVVDGPPFEVVLAGRAHLVRRVLWRGMVPRSTLMRPYQLQDPQLLFALRGEAAIGD